MLYNWIKISNQIFVNSKNTFLYSKFKLFTYNFKYNKNTKTLTPTFTFRIKYLSIPMVIIASQNLFDLLLTHFGHKKWTYNIKSCLKMGHW